MNFTCIILVSCLKLYFHFSGLNGYETNLQNGSRSEFSVNNEFNEGVSNIEKYNANYSERNRDSRRNYLHSKLRSIYDNQDSDHTGSYEKHSTDNNKQTNKNVNTQSLSRFKNPETVQSSRKSLNSIVKRQSNSTTNMTSHHNIKTPLRPTRKAPDVPANRRPSVPPPPPPAPPPPLVSSRYSPPPPPTEPPPPPPSEPPPPIPSEPMSSSASKAAHASKSSNILTKTALHYRDISDMEYIKEVEDYPDYSTSPSYSPPSTPPPPLPTSPPPLLHHSDHIIYASADHSSNKVSPRSSNSSNSNYQFTSFRGDVTVPISKPLSSSHNSSADNSPRREISINEGRHSLPQTMPIFSTIDEETKTATIRGRIKPSRSALTLDINSSHSSKLKNIVSPQMLSNRQPNPSLSSFDPLRRPRSMSPDDPYEHIYEELGSIPSFPTDPNQSHTKLRRLVRKSHHTSHPNLYEGSANTLKNTQSSRYPRQETLRHAQTLPPGIGKSIFDGATKKEILEILKNAKGRISSSAEEDEDEDEVRP